jgi:hypothetical protein
MYGFFADQSYVKGIGDIGDVISNVPGAVVEGFGNLAKQMVPMSSFIRNVNTMIDPIYRKGNKETSFGKVYSTIAKDIPVWSKSLAPYTDASGQPARRPNPVINAISPLGFFPENPEDKAKYKKMIGLEQRADLRKKIEGEGKVQLKGALNRVDVRIASLEKGELVAGLEERVRGAKGPNPPAELVNAYKEGKISAADLNRIWKERGDTPLVSAFRGLKFSDAIAAYEKFSPSERRQVFALMVQKTQSLDPKVVQKYKQRILGMPKLAR